MSTSMTYNTDTLEATFTRQGIKLTLSGLTFEKAQEVSQFLDDVIIWTKGQMRRKFQDELDKLADSL